MTKFHSFQIIGERCSGTVWIEKLLRKHFTFTEQNPVEGNFLYGWKHNPKLPEKPDKSVLFVFVVRNYTDWFESFCRKPWHVPYWISKDAQSMLGARPWAHCNDDSRDFYRHGTPFVKPKNLTPFLHTDLDWSKNGAPFESLLHMRKSKHLQWMKFHRSHLRSSVWVRYEDVLENTSEFLTKIARFIRQPVPSMLGVDTNAHSLQKFDKAKQIEKQVFFSSAKVDIPKEIEESETIIGYPKRQSK